LIFLVFPRFFLRLGRSKVTSPDWICEMVLWMHWFHRGRLVAKASTELIELDAPQFHKLILHHSASFRLCRTYALLYMELLQKNIGLHGLSAFTDLCGNPDDIIEMLRKVVTLQHVARSVSSTFVQSWHSKGAISI